MDPKVSEGNRSQIRISVRRHGYRLFKYLGRSYGSEHDPYLLDFYLFWVEDEHQCFEWESTPFF